MAERITDVYKQIKKARRCHKEVKTSSRVSEDNRNVALPKNNPSDLQILKEFDLALEFGPCAGITRLERWERAFKHGFDPPLCVKDILIKHQDHKQYNHCLWNDYDI
ncbi:DNA polymerase delta subunit 4-like isoform X1 [Pomacea canaliculata]|uniref:DNA polymerase delta subunit 4-like isoform X1 n=1 Tax=Pomacea canaliculata TaxID=400727 RepID=UPI000D72A059|nr:DNA polymerase delta subunit 4-like isoform X1 [Pomacea canaliculata]